MKCKDVMYEWTKEELEPKSLSYLCVVYVHAEREWKREDKRKGPFFKIYEKNKRLVNAELKRRRN
jgi:hypothetical protein